MENSLKLQWPYEKMKNTEKQEKCQVFDVQTKDNLDYSGFSFTFRLDVTLLVAGKVNANLII